MLEVTHVKARFVEMVPLTLVLRNLHAFASASKRARAEVQIKDLSPEDRRLFDLAKDAETQLLVTDQCPETSFEKVLESRSNFKVQMGINMENQ